MNFLLSFFSHFFFFSALSDSEAEHESEDEAEEESAVEEGEEKEKEEDLLSAWCCSRVLVRAVTNLSKRWRSSAGRPYRPVSHKP